MPTWWDFGLSPFARFHARTYTKFKQLRVFLESQLGLLVFSADDSVLKKAKRRQKFVESSFPIGHDLNYISTISNETASI